MPQIGHFFTPAPAARNKGVPESGPKRSFLNRKNPKKIDPGKIFFLVIRKNGQNWSQRAPRNCTKKCKNALKMTKKWLKMVKNDELETYTELWTARRRLCLCGLSLGGAWVGAWEGAPQGQRGPGRGLRLASAGPGRGSAGPKGAISAAGGPNLARLRGA